MIDAVIRSLLVCPSCRGELDDGPGVLTCRSCEVSYPVVEGVPYLVVECARRDGDDKKK
jgi:uncharacterized protein YbaR (Trm112 family)